MSSKIQFVEAENTHKEYPNAFIIDEAMFKVNGKYVCVEPCGGGGFLLWDQYVYISSTGDDNSQEGLIDDPFLTIAGAMEYINSFITIGGDIFVVFLDEGPFYIEETVVINHHNKITFIGEESIVPPDPDPPDPDPPVVSTIWYGDKFVMAGTLDAGSNFQTFSISSGGASTYFGSTSSTHPSHYAEGASMSNGATGVIAGGTDSNGSVDTMDYITFAIESDLTTFGNLTGARAYPSGCCNGEIGLILGGFNVASSITNESIESILMASTGNSSYWGTMTERINLSASIGNTEIALNCGGYDSSGIVDVCNYIDKFEYASMGNATRYGNITSRKSTLSGCSNSTYGWIVGGEDYNGDPQNRIERISFASESNATIWGNSQYAMTYPACASNGNDIGVIAGGYNYNENITQTEIGTFTLSFYTFTSNFGTLSPGESWISGMSGD